jgi:hypothetical protein
VAIAQQPEMESGLRGQSSGRHTQAANTSGSTPRSRFLLLPPQAGPTPGTPSFSRRAPWLARCLTIALLGLATWAAYHELRTYPLTDFIASLTSLPIEAVVAAIALTTAGHLVHVGYDGLALRYAEHPLPWRRAAFGSLITYSVSAVTGFTGVIGASLRYRFRSAWGVSRNEIAKGVGFAVLTAGLGATAAAAARSRGILRRSRCRPESRAEHCERSEQG